MACSLQMIHEHPEGERIVVLNSNQIKNQKPGAYADGGALP
jgi:hypothetical protein